MVVAIIDQLVIIIIVVIIIVVIIIVIIMIALYGGRIREEVGRSRLDGGCMTGPVRSEFTF